jgi:hypothetical protein
VIDYLVVGGGTIADSATRSVTSITGITGFPGIRGDAFDRPEEDGGIDPTGQYQSARVISVEGEIWGASNAAMWADWRSFAGTLETAISTDTLLQWRDAGGTIALRGYCRLIGDLLPTLTADEQGPFLRYLAQFRLVDPRWVSDTEQNGTVGAPTASGGMPLPVVFPIPFGSGSSGGSTTVTNAGNTKTWPTIVIQGPIVGPVVESVTLGRVLSFPTLSLGDGQTLTITTNPDGRAATVAGASVLGNLDYQNSRWFYMPPGANTIRFYGSSGYGVGTALTVYWRDAYNS